MSRQGTAVALLVAACLAHDAVPALSQTGSGVAFEVASVKPAKPGSFHGNCYGAPPPLFQFAVESVTIPNGRCVFSGARLSHLISFAYDVPTGRIEHRPDWDNDHRFDVEAKAANAAASYDELRMMLQGLLADRFKLRFQREARMTPGLALVIEAGGPKLRASSNPQDAPSLVVRGAAVNKLDAADQRRLDLNTLSAKRVSMARLAEALSQLPGGPVVDTTGLTSVYDFTLEWEPDESPANVLPHQLGLQLRRQDVPVDVLVIESAKQPIEN